MVQQPIQLSAKGLLSAMVATLLCGQALAETAGRVTFVAGQVNIISADGQRRLASKGELLNSGERLETGKGRLQIRFTDGSLISLQPNTVFGLDNYTFNQAKPQEGSLAFNFVRGGIRTVTGAIGRVNRANYKVLTPVGTIGIRGTAYTATQEPDGRLLVTVNKGMVNLSNDFGNRNVPAGNTFQIERGHAPQPAEAGVMAEVLANAPQAPEREDEKKETPIRGALAQQEINLGLDVLAPDNDFEQANQSNNLGQPNVQVFPFFIQSANGQARLSHFASLLQGASDSLIQQNIFAAYDTVSVDGQNVGNLVGIISSPLTGNGIANNLLLLDTRNNVNPVQFRGVKQVRSLSFGEWTNGQMATADNSVNINTLSLGANTFIPYIVGISANKDLGNHQRISYRLADLTHASPARAGQSIGQLTKLNLDIDLNVQPLISIDMALTLDGVNYTAVKQNHALDVLLNQKLSSFSINGINDLFFASSSNGACNNNLCPVTLEGFFSGADVGAIYQIDRPNSLANIGGVAVLTGGNSSTIDSVIPSSAKVDSSLTGKYTALFSNNAGISISPNPVSNLAAIFNSTTGGLQQAFKANDLSNSYGAVNTAQQTTAQTSQIQHVDKVLTWGVWSNGTVDVNDPVQNSYSLNNQQQIHYLLATPTLNLPTANQVLYSFQGGTTPTVNAAQAISAQVLTTSYLAIDFGANNADLHLNLNLSPTTGSSQLLSATGSTNLSNTGQFNFDNLSIKLGSGNSCNSLGCSGTATGLLAGNNGLWAGLSYSLNAVNSTFNDGLFIQTQGVAAFKQDTNVVIPVTQVADSDLPIYSALLSSQINDNPQISIQLEQAQSVSASFNNQNLAWQAGNTGTTLQGTPDYGYLSTVNSNSATEVTHHKQTLSWGRWVNSTVSVGDNSKPVTLAANDSVHYIVGVPAASLPTAGIVTYLHAGSTTPTGTVVTPTTNGSPANTISPLTGLSVASNSKMVVNFASFANDAIKLDMNFTTGAQGNINFQGQSALANHFNLNNLTVNSQACDNCAANGFFAGSNASMIGLNYDVKAQLGNSTANMTGVAAFEK